MTKLIVSLSELEKIKKRGKCECSDPGCQCKGKCIGLTDGILYRIDMQDYSGTAFCIECASDALESGLFTFDEPPANE